MVRFSVRVIGEVVAVFVVASTVVIVETSAGAVGPAVILACSISDMVATPVVVASPVVVMAFVTSVLIFVAASVIAAL